MTICGAQTRPLLSFLAPKMATDTSERKVGSNSNSGSNSMTELHLTAPSSPKNKASFSHSYSYANSR